MKKILKWLDVNFEPLLIAVLFAALILLITVQVILRFSPLAAFSWGEEISRFMFVWLMYFSFSYATRNNRHIRVSFFVKKTPENIQKIILFICDILFLIFAGFVLVACFNICRTASRFNDMATTIEISMNILYAAGVFGYILMVIRIAQGIIWKIKHWKDDVEIFENFGGEFTPDNKVFFDTVPENEFAEIIDRDLEEVYEKEEGK
ncbi:MAG: TRAP transporter small permease [Eubacterium sp.]|nr:TRAP transporter small permease [Eubacterium sp.]